MEAELIDWLRRTLPGSARLRIGLGDDAAALLWPKPHDCVLTTDLLTEGVDFLLADVDPRRIGRKALAVNLSDLAAMAARPVAALVSLALPRAGGSTVIDNGSAGGSSRSHIDPLALAQRLYEGMIPLAEQFGVVIAGGDTNTWDGGLVISITAIGESTPRGLVRRGGARPGDWIVATGSFGGSLSGKQFDFTPRVREALLLNERYQLHAATDVSDGLSLDLGHIAQASGCGAVIDATALPIAAAAREPAAPTSGIGPIDAPDLGKIEAPHPTIAMPSNGHPRSVRALQTGSPLDRALSDGEDFELILAVPPDDAARMLNDQPVAVPLACIGRFVAAAGLWLSAGPFDNSPQPITPRGFQHGADGTERTLD